MDGRRKIFPNYIKGYLAPKALEYKNYFYLGIFLEILIIVVSLFETDSQVTFLQAATRYSGRLSFFFFTVIFLHAGLYPKIEEALNTSLFHRSFTVYFAILHLIHFGFLASYNVLAGNELIPIRLAGGVIAYVTLVIYPILLFTNLTSKWLSVARQFYLYFLFFIFLMTYLPRVKRELPGVSGRIEAYYALFVILLLVLVIHLLLRLFPAIRKLVLKHPMTR